MTPDQLQELRGIERAATEGPWTPHDGYIWFPRDRTDAETEANARFIATARTAIPELLDEVERLRTALERLHRTGKVVSDAGAMIGPHWVPFNTALLFARSALGQGKFETKAEYAAAAIKTTEEKK